MANWKDTVSRAAQTAKTKTKEVAEVTRLNVEISSLEQKIRDAGQRLGDYLLANPGLLGGCGDETVAEIFRQVEELKQQIEADRQAVRDARNVNVCPNCGAEVSRTSRFCDRCGAPLEQVRTDPVCPQCGAPVEPDAAFCGNCGAKLK